MGFKVDLLRAGCLYMEWLDEFIEGEALEPGGHGGNWRGMGRKLDLSFSHE